MAVDLVSLGLACADVAVRPVNGYPQWGALSLVPNLEIHLGGLAAVTATVFNQLGGKAAFIGKVGADGFGKFLLQAMESYGVDVEHVGRAENTGSSATVVLIKEDGERGFMHCPGATALLTDEDVDYDFIQQAKVLHWGGPAVTPGLDGEPIARVLKRAREMGLKTSMDTCYDGADQWFSRIEHALPNLDIVMSSLEEARKYTGKEEPEAIADFYLSFGAEIALIKLGPQGVFVKNTSESHHVPTPDAPVVDTTGAGDAACAGFLRAYLEGWDLLKCAQLANAVGALTVTHIGGAEAIRSLDDTIAFMKEGYS